MNAKKLLQWSFLALAVAGMAGCERATEPESKRQTVGLEGADFVEVDIGMGAGELRLQGGAADLMEGTFRYNVERWTPQVDYRVVDKQGKLSIRQRRRTGLHLGRTENTWEIRLNNRVPMDMTVHLGAGTSDLDLREFALKRLDIGMGVGELNLDLSGARKENLSVNIDGGVGSGTIYLPKDCGIRAEISGGIGSIHAPGFRQDGHAYANEVYGKTPASIDLHIEAGIGSIELRLR